MKLWTLSALGVSIALTSASALAQDADADPGPDPQVDSDEGQPAAPEQSEAKSSASAQHQVDTSVGLSAKAATDTSTETEAKAEAATARSRRGAVYGKRSEWSIEPYGYARFDAIIDSTQSFDDGLQPWLIQRVGTYRGDHGRATLSARDSRFGWQVGAPEWAGIKSSANIEVDFYGLTVSDAKKHDQVVFAPLRIRHAFLKLETSIVDIIAGQTYDVFGWGSTFYPSTGGYLGVPGEIYHRNPQLRLERTFHAGPLGLTLAIAGVRPGQRDNGGFPDGEGGIKLALDSWSGISTAGFGRPTRAPISVGISGLYRRFEVPIFQTDPGSADTTATGYGLAAQVLLPAIPADSVENKANALTFTGEFSLGTGIAEMYGGMDGGSRFPVLPNPAMLNPPKAYPQNIDPGLVTFDRNWELKTINWKAIVAGGQYYLPIGNGIIWLSGIYSRAWSDNIKELTPPASYGGVFTKMEYIDGTLGVEITPAVAVGLSFQTLKQTFADVSAPTPVFGEIAQEGTPGSPTVPNSGGVPATARHNRGMFSMALFF